MIQWVYTTFNKITMAPAMTLSDKEFQLMPEMHYSECIRKIGVDTGGSNVQFAVNLIDGRIDNH